MKERNDTTQKPHILITKGWYHVEYGSDCRYLSRWCGAFDWCWAMNEKMRRNKQSC